MNIAHAAEEGIHISLAAEPLFSLGGFTITSALTATILVVLLLSLMAVLVGTNVKKIPGKTQAFFELVFGGVLDYMEEVLESRSLAVKYFPLIVTLFFFILFSNWIAMLPGIHDLLFKVMHDGHAEYVHFFQAANTDLNTPLVLAIIAFLFIEIVGIATLGTITYAKKFFNFSSVMGFFVGIIELISEFARIITFSFRLFGNLFAGKVLLTVLIFFIPVLLPVPMIAYEVGVGLIQAAVFALLTLFFIKLAIAAPH